ncbi:bifunctional adenosylcobinamide kinase/adenosylcobinamide-phosphate guanylyltransferase [Hyphomonas sp. WL0036]|uniref:bifunctional adenosylcobinamide kinase/adenosylcobinamide-phosphate guanylyltransferase n=1 Tax=Hyphomonas sediminis TaxID=2866160 RepID=UPI001C81E168|nr:bifunctional adenosylcobinamide kinase/adenosylcobinamide-phosphate guanylyltransferase [Hyphomonas sediminis]MBY9068179.1 bifunctional adenosylcobinamide kinase/adenosylcobinamide-phosphate guanylyltransferase [Hyphomonas sediminis]
MPTTLLLGGARSGKSRRAQDLAEQASPHRVFIATAEPLDEEMESRIARHQADRVSGWRTLETPLDLVSALGEAEENEAVVVDCLTLWLSNLMHHGRNVDAEIEKLCVTLFDTSKTVLLVSNEIGLGLVPETKLGRSFRDAQGRLNQRVASACGVVEFVAAGLPLRLKS